jgi:succinoglycan biosynthesis protein ExoM
MNITLCISTYRRPDRLGALLKDLVLQQRPPDEIVVVDNDALGSARAVVERQRSAGSPCPIHYAIQPVPNISSTRNRTVELAHGDWLAFIDDDERAPSAWLRKLVQTAHAVGTDVVLGPVVPVVPGAAPAWIRRGRFYDWTRMPTGEAVPLNKLRFGNVLLRAELLQAADSRFDLGYGLTGGEDGDLLTRLVQKGAAIHWCDEAVVFEPVERSRLTLRWLVLRSLRGGQDFARHRLNGRFGPIAGLGRLALVSRALAQAAAAAGLALLNWPRGKHCAVYWLLKASANVGKISVFLGWHYREYAAAPSS